MQESRLRKSLLKGLLSTVMLSSVLTVYQPATSNASMGETVSVEDNRVKGGLQYSAASGNPEDTHWGYMKTLPYKPNTTNVLTKLNGFTGKGVKIAVFDSGINDHTEFKVAGGVNLIGSDPNNYRDDYGHGTHIAGIIGAKRDGKGMSGVAPEASIYSVKVLNEKGQGSLAAIVKGIDWAIANDMDIISMSIAYSQNYEPFNEAVKRARVAGITVVVSAGNWGKPIPGKSTVSGFANAEGVITVSSLNSRMEISQISSQGSGIDIAAPGENIYSTKKDGKNYELRQGTSVAAPFVTGVIALIKQKYPLLTPDQIDKKLKLYVKDIGKSGRDELFGDGYVSFYDQFYLFRDTTKVTDTTGMDVTAKNNLFLTSYNTEFKKLVPKVPTVIKANQEFNRHHKYVGGRVRTGAPDPAMAGMWIGRYHAVMSTYKKTKQYTKLVNATAYASDQLLDNSTDPAYVLALIRANVSSKYNVGMIIRFLQSKGHDTTFLTPYYNTLK